MSYATAGFVSPLPLDVGLLRVPGVARARVLRVCGLVAGSGAFAVAVWTLMTAIMLLG